MVRLLNTLLATLFALSLTLFPVIASPTPVPALIGDSDISQLAKRITHTGRGTWYEAGYGNCGYHDKGSDPIVAISIQSYGRGNNCNQWMRITNTANGKVAYGKTRDSCQSCGPNDIDMSYSLFSKLDNPSKGVLKVSWHFMEKGWQP